MAGMPDTAKNLQAHLEGFTNATDLDVKLVDTFRLQLNDDSRKAALPIFLPLLTKTLPLTSSPQPLCALLIALLEPICFSDLLSLTTPAEILPTLTFPNAHIQLMGLKLLQKATASPSEARSLASHPELVASIVNLSLVASNTEVADLAAKTLLDLLNVDLVGPGGVGEGLIWRRVFGDKDIYQIFFDNCSWKNKSASMSRAEKTLAQARLLAMLPKMAGMNWEVVSRSHFPQVEARFEGEGTLDGLLGFATAMVEMEFDVLMYMTVIEFYSDFLLVCPTPERGAAAGSEVYATSKGLEYLVANNRHQTTIALYTTPPSEQADQFTASFLTSRSARYIATYATHFPTHLRDSKDLLPKILKALGSYIPGPTGQGPHAPSLHLLASLPPSEILGIVLEIPLAPPHPDYLKTLATILPGDEKVYREYTRKNPSFYKKLTEYASVIALKENAQASLRMLKGLAGSSFGLREVVGNTHVMEFLVTVPQRVNIAAGRGGDEGSAYGIARSRYEVVEAVAKGMAGGGAEFDTARRVWGRVVNERVQGGVYGSGVGVLNGAGGSVAWQGM
ncbi:hypothetical protein TWF696_001713 [Orbilia brochopaga]|uniref:Uncharacterized protein n=1 Tax=Orbilia brochopaga TaxID=3140254 RepID=A0AAV9U5S9_9PEZI